VTYGPPLHDLDDDEWLQELALELGDWTRPPALAGERVTQDTIIDCHCHAGPGDGFQGPWDSRAALGVYLRRAREAGIQRTVLFGAFHSDSDSCNRAVARYVSLAPERLLGFVFVHAERDRGRVFPVVNYYVRRHRFCGIKVHRHQARLSREICDVARRLRVPVLYDVGGETTQAGLYADEYPDVDFIIPHLGSFADDWAAQTALIDVLCRKRNVYADTSGVRRHDLLEEALRRAGPEKLLFGSDGPWIHPAVELAKIEHLPLTPAARRMVLGGNLLRLVRKQGRQPSVLASSSCSARSVTLSNLAAR
jgi:predicted TIM-barrel fold metal-dependent hydrolase